MPYKGVEVLARPDGELLSCFRCEESLFARHETEWSSWGIDFEGIHHAGNCPEMIVEDMRRLREIEEQGAARRFEVAKGGRLSRQARRRRSRSVEI